MNPSIHGKTRDQGTGDFHEAASTFQKGQHLRYLDALRGFAILGVILVHSNRMVFSNTAGMVYNLTFSGQRGVQLFYVLSAFTLCYSFDVRPERESHPLKNYFIRRFFRIAPLFYFAVLGCLLINGTGPRYDAPNGVSPFYILSGLFFLNGLHPNTINSIAMGGWSIAVETSFYLVLPVVLSMVHTLRCSAILLVIAGIFAPLLSHWCVHFLPGERWHEYFTFLWFPIEFPVFCMGIFAYYLWKKYGNDPIARHRKLISFLLILGAALIFLTSLPITNSKLYWSSIAFVPLILGLSLWEWKVVVNPVAVFLGKISYSLYLMHFFCLIPINLVWLHVRKILSPAHDLQNTLSALVIVFLLVSVSSVVLSTITYFLIERPGMRCGKNLIQRWEKAPISARI